jgi:hypothetical protein
VQPDGQQTIAFSRTQLRLLLAIDGRRTVAELSCQDRVGGTLVALAGLVESGLVRIDQPGISRKPGTSKLLSHSMGVVTEMLRLTIFARVPAGLLLMLILLTRSAA